PPRCRHGSAPEGVQRHGGALSVRYSRIQVAGPQEKSTLSPDRDPAEWPLSRELILPGGRKPPAARLARRGRAAAPPLPAPVRDTRRATPAPKFAAARDRAAGGRTGRGSGSRSAGTASPLQAIPRAAPAAGFPAGSRIRPADRS